MRKKISIAMALAIVTILTTLTLSNQVFAQQATHCMDEQSVLDGISGIKSLGIPYCNSAPMLGGQQAQLGNNHVLATQPVLDRVPHVGQVLGGITTTIQNILKGGLGPSDNPLGDVCLSCWGG